MSDGIGAGCDGKALFRGRETSGGNRKLVQSDWGLRQLELAFRVRLGFQSEGRLGCLQRDVCSSDGPMLRIVDDAMNIGEYVCECRNGSGEKKDCGKNRRKTTHKD